MEEKHSFGGTVVKRRRTLTLKSFWESGSFVTPRLLLVSCPKGGANYGVRWSMLAGVRRVPIIRSSEYRPLRIASLCSASGL